VTRLLILLYLFRVATLDELWLWLVELEDVAEFVVEGLKEDTVAREELLLLELLKLLELVEVEVAVVAVFGVVEELRADTIVGEELSLLGLLKLSGMQLELVPQLYPAGHQTRPEQQVAPVGIHPVPQSAKP
jgi:hypothetical protein